MNASTLRRAAGRAKRLWIARPPGLGQPDTTRAWRRVRHLGMRRRCPVCHARVRRFLATPPPLARPEALCPVCGALEWHRFGWWYLEAHHGDVLRPGARVLHVAAEPALRPKFLAIPGIRYIALDLDLRRATVVGDLQALPLAEGSIDLVYCSHVLEHVYDDRVAMAELRRIISPGGAALIQVPVSAEVTWGDPTITDPAERTRLFGLHDHVRRYGPDVVDILTEQGWNVERINTLDLEPSLVDRHGMPHHEIARPAFDVFWCTPR